MLSYYKHLRGGWFFIIFVLYLSTGAGAWAQGARTTSLYVEDLRTHEQTEFSVELALTDAQRQKGLMYRKSLAENEGMLFIFRDEALRSFWMRNTYIALDIIFVKADGTIVNIVEAEPLTDNQRRSSSPAKAVLEIRRGLSKELGIEAGDIVRHALLGNLKSPKPILDH